MSELPPPPPPATNPVELIESIRDRLEPQADNYVIHGALADLARLEACTEYLLPWMSMAVEFHMETPDGIIRIVREGPGLWRLRRGGSVFVVGEGWVKARTKAEVDALDGSRFTAAQALKRAQALAPGHP